MSKRGILNDLNKIRKIVEQMEEPMPTTVPTAEEFAALSSKVDTLAARIAVLEVPAPPPSPPPLPPPGLLFSNRYDGTVALAAGSGGWQNIIGADSQGKEWKAGALWNCHQPRIQRIGVQAWFDNGLEALQGKDGTNVRALRLRMTNSDAGTGGSGQDVMVIEPGVPVTEFYTKQEIKLPDNLATVLSQTSGRNWCMLQEWKTGGLWNSGQPYGGDFRCYLSLFRFTSGAFAWAFRCDRNANDPAVSAHVYADTQAQSPAMVSGAWITLEHYVKRSAGSDGLIWFKVDGVEVGRLVGNNIGPNNEPINRLFLANMYCGGFTPAAYRLANLEIRDRLP